MLISDACKGTFMELSSKYYCTVQNFDGTKNINCKFNDFLNNLSNFPCQNFVPCDMNKIYLVLCVTHKLAIGGNLYRECFSFATGAHMATILIPYYFDTSIVPL